MENLHVQNVFFPDLPVWTASFTADGKQVVASGRRRYFYCYDLEAARVDKIHQIVGRDEKSLEKFIVSPDNQYLAFMGTETP